jgi:hypothetical protein
MLHICIMPKFYIEYVKVVMIVHNLNLSLESAIDRCAYVVIFCCLQQGIEVSPF